MQVDNLILIKSIGKGSFGEVFLTKKKDSNELYATKRLDRAFSEKPDNMRLLTNEIKILKGIKHPNIVRLIELKKTKTHVYIVTEYCNGGDLTTCLQKYVNKNYKPFSEEIVQYLMKQIISAINFLHIHKILHRDLKLDNILVNFPTEEDKKNNNMMKAVVKLIDFGFATILRSSKANLTYTVLGTPTNMAPNLLQNMEEKKRKREGYDEKADIWSLGTLCYEMLEGHLTFGGKDINELFQKVKDGNYSLPLNSSKEVVSFINGMLQYDPNKRLSAQELLNHDFLTKEVKSFHKIDTKDIVNKISGNDIKINIKDNKTIWKVFNQDNNTQIQNNYQPQNNPQFQNIQTNIIQNNNNQYINKNNYMFNKKNEIPQNRNIYQQNNYISNRPNSGHNQYAQVTKINTQQIKKKEVKPDYYNYHNNLEQGMFPIPEMNQEHSNVINHFEMGDIPNMNEHKYY